MIARAFISGLIVGLMFGMVIGIAASAWDVVK